MEGPERRANKNPSSTAKAVTYERVVDLFVYDPQSGALVRKSKGKSVGTGYKKRAMVNIDGNIVSLHRVIWLYMTGEWPKQVDHINGNPLDNRWENLRNATNTENSRNSRKPKNNTSGYKGVSFIPRLNKYRATIMVNRRSLHLGCYYCPKEAAAAYNTAAKEHFGEYALLNDI